MTFKILNQSYSYIGYFDRMESPVALLPVHLKQTHLKNQVVFVNVLKEEKKFHYLAI